MNSIETLRQIGVKEVARRTHIEPQIIELILDKNYEALAKYNAGGHIKIIVREFDVDMSEWLSEYALAVPDSCVAKSCGAVDKIPPFTDSADRDARPAGRGLMWLGVIIILIAGFVYFFGEKVGLDKLIQDLQNSQKSAISFSSEQVEQAKRSIDENDETKPVATQDKPEAKTTSQNESNIDNTNAAAEPAKDKNEPALAPENTQNKEVEQNSQPANEPAVEVKQDNKTQQEQEIKQDKEPVLTAKTATLKTIKKVWVGVINLKTKTKKSYDAPANKEFELDLNTPQLIVAGNGNVSLTVGDKKQSFSPSGAVRLLAKDGKIKQISYDEFVSLNGGKSW